MDVIRAVASRLVLRIGVAVADDAVRAVIVNRGLVKWMQELPRGPGDSIEALVAQALREAPHSRWYRLGVTVAIGPSLAQVKQVPGLPPLEDGASVSRMIQEGAPRFFLQGDTPLITSRVSIDSAGACWAAAMEHPLMLDLVRGCELAGVRLVRVVPTVAILYRAMRDRAFWWRDGATQVRIVAHATEMLEVQRVVPAPHCDDIPPVCDALTRRSADAWRFADAYAAALVESLPPLAFEVRRDARRPRPIPRWRWLLASTVYALGLAASLLLPPLRAVRSTHQARARLAVLAQRRQVALGLQRELGSTSSALRELDTFQAGRRSMTTLLASITAALPARSSILDLRVDSVGVGLVILTPETSKVLSLLDRSRGVINPSIVGPVQHEVVAGGQYERATIQFRHDLSTTTGSE